MPTFGPSSRTIRRWLKIMGNQDLLWNWAADDAALTLLLQAIELLAMGAAWYWARALATGQGLTSGER
ncbi:MAG: hypothetical protein II007_03300 [Gammaproteobacteria bacterium]|nr:hypothetical protein [Gammaproteobacteria bacterium]